jgi:hypothetical protein
MKAIATVKLPRNPKHNPSNKVKGECPLSKQIGVSIYCSDATGEHHSYIEEGKTIAEIEDKAKRKFGHITRIEILEEIELL